jgi:hypothetical protein
MLAVPKLSSSVVATDAKVQVAKRLVCEESESTGYEPSDVHSGIIKNLTYK